MSSDPARSTHKVSAFILAFHFGRKNTDHLLQRFAAEDISPVLELLLLFVSQTETYRLETPTWRGGSFRVITRAVRSVLIAAWEL